MVDIQNLNYFNGVHIRRKFDSDLGCDEMLKLALPHVKDYTAKYNVDISETSDEHMKKVLNAVSERVTHIQDFGHAASYFFVKPDYNS